MNTSPKNRYTEKVTDWIGSTQSVIVHIVFIIGMFVLPFFGVSFNRILLILTTFLSIESIFLAIFIQMTVNRTTDSIEEITEDKERDELIDKDVSTTLRTIEKRLNRLQNDLKLLKEKGLM
jgi:uncharacterized membrane protein